MPLRSHLSWLAVTSTVATVLALLAAAPLAATEDVFVEYHLPFAAGTSLTVTQGWNGDVSHVGQAVFAYDFAVQEGTPVLASAAGRVGHAHTGEQACGGAELLESANYVTLDHLDGTATHYGHLADVYVLPGQQVAVGQVIGRVGRTGYTNCTAHLHFARQLAGGPVTQSIPIAFAEYPGLELAARQVVVGGLAAVNAAIPIELEQVTTVELRSDVAGREAVRERLATVRSFYAGLSDWSVGEGQGTPSMTRQTVAP